MSIRAGDTPVPIPNTTVKPCTADGTLLETTRENRRAPEHFLKNKGSPKNEVFWGRGAITERYELGAKRGARESGVDGDVGM